MIRRIDVDSNNINDYIKDDNTKNNNENGNYDDNDNDKNSMGCDTTNIQLSPLLL